VSRLSIHSISFSLTYARKNQRLEADFDALVPEFANLTLDEELQIP